MFVVNFIRDSLTRAEDNIAINKSERTLVTLLATNT